MKISATQEDFLQRLKNAGQAKYHSHHPFHLRMHQGVLSKDEIQRWVLNRFYYQKNLPIKDAFVLSKLPSREDRRRWLQRIIDHDGRAAGEGGIESWLHLGEAVGLSTDEMLSGSGVVPGVRFAVDAYVNFCRHEHWLAAVGSSLTELFAPGLMAQRIAVLEEHYKWISSDSLRYFRNRLSQAPRDVDHALELVLNHADTPELQEKVLCALEFKCNVLWSMLDGIELASTGKLINAG